MINDLAIRKSFNEKPFLEKVMKNRFYIKSSYLHHEYLKVIIKDVRSRPMVSYSVPYAVGAVTPYSEPSSVPCAA